MYPSPPKSSLLLRTDTSSSTATITTSPRPTATAPHPHQHAAPPTWEARRRQPIPTPNRPYYEAVSETASVRSIPPSSPSANETNLGCDRAGIDDETPPRKRNGPWPPQPPLSRSIDRSKNTIEINIH
mmetsp:Transcript_20550/g.48373  ORF Transcript_20550/g.48373 Transcript_20550/m.48373 type:complete len:128 (-) Transcript_20550:25-408(-)